MLKKVVFLDRDGVINEDSENYIKSIREFHFLPDSLDALCRLHRHGFTSIVITNQSAVGREMISREELERIHRHLLDSVRKAGGGITDIFFCPHRPDRGCDCRKPKTGLIRKAVQKHGIDLSRATMIGDSARDILCGKNAGCSKTVLVLTGNGFEAREQLMRMGRMPDEIAANLAQAVDRMTAHEKKS